MRWTSPMESLCNRAIETGRPVENVELARKTKDAELTVFADYYPVRDQTGAVLGVNIVVQDITERKRAEEALQEKRAPLNAIPEQHPGYGLAQGPRGPVHSGERCLWHRSRKGSGAT